MRKIRSEPTHRHVAGTVRETHNHQFIMDLIWLFVESTPFCLALSLLSTTMFPFWTNERANEWHTLHHDGKNKQTNQAHTSASKYDLTIIKLSTGRTDFPTPTKVVEWPHAKRDSETTFMCTWCGGARTQTHSQQIHSVWRCLYVLYCTDWSDGLRSMRDEREKFSVCDGNCIEDQASDADCRMIRTLLSLHADYWR